MDAFTSPADYYIDSTGFQGPRAPIAPISTFFTGYYSETPSSHDVGRLLALNGVTGFLQIEEDAEFVAEKAFRFMQLAAKTLPISEESDLKADLLAQRIHGELEFSPITKELSE